MNDQDYIRKAVELADNFQNFNDEGVHLHMELDFVPYLHTYLDAMDESDQWFLDALAAQLARQINSMEDYAIHIEPGKTILCGVTYTDKGFESHHTIDVCEGDDPTMNTTKVIVDSKVLE